MCVYVRERESVCVCVRAQAWGENMFSIPQTDASRVFSIHQPNGISPSFLPPYPELRSAPLPTACPIWEPAADLRPQHSPAHGQNVGGNPAAWSSSG